MNEEVTHAEILASILEGTGQTKTVSLIRPVNYRAPIHFLAVIDAMAEHAGKSRSFIMSRLINVGICAVKDSLVDKTTIKALEALQAKHATLLMDGSIPETDRE